MSGFLLAIGIPLNLVLPRETPLTPCHPLLHPHRKCEMMWFPAGGHEMGSWFFRGWKTTFEALLLVKSNQPTIAIRAAGYP